MMATQNIPTKLILKFADKPTTTNSNLKDKLDQTYKDLFASLLKIKDKDVQRRVLQAINGQNLTCANCANTISTNGISTPKSTQNKSNNATQTLARDFEFVDKINSSPTNTSPTSTNDCSLSNKIQLGRAKRKFEPYAVKTEREPCIIPNKKASYLRYSYEPDSLLRKIKKPKLKTESPSGQLIPKNYSITEKLLLDNLIEQSSMSPHGFFNFKPNEQPSKINDFIFVSTMEQEMRTAQICNEEGLYTIHIAAINGDLYKMRRLLIIYQYYKWDINIRSEDEKKESPLHHAVSSGKIDIVNLLYDKGADVLATNNEGDTVLHLAAETIRDYHLIEKLLSKISIDDLTKHNDKSRTILHIAASHKNRIFVKLILNFLDEKLSISSIGKEIPFTDTAEYFDNLDALHLNYVKMFINENFKKPSIHSIKSKILDEQDGRSGKTALFLSLEDNDQSTCLMLIAHFADTRIPDFSNATCAFYSSEILKNRIIAQAIYNADSLHNSVVFKALKQTERQRSTDSRKRVQLDSLDIDDGGDIMSKVAKVLS